MSNPKISVIVPAYNSSDYIRQCIDSLQVQRFTDFEVIVVNDGSTDDTLEIVRELQEKDSRIILINQANQGQGTARNNGLNKACGDTVLFLDADDYYAEDTLEIMYTALINSKCEVAVFNGKAFYESNDGPIVWSENPYYSLSDTEANIMQSGLELVAKTKGRIQSPCMKIHTREFLQQHDIRFLEGGFGEDTYFFYNMMIYAKRVMYIHHIGFYRRYHADTTMTGSSIRNIQNRILTFPKLFELLALIEEEHFALIVRKQMLHYACFLWIMAMNRSGDDRSILLNDFSTVKLDQLLSTNSQDVISFIFSLLISDSCRVNLIKQIFAKICRRMLKNKTRFII